MISSANRTSEGQMPCLSTGNSGVVLPYCRHYFALQSSALSNSVIGLSERLQRCSSPCSPLRLARVSPWSNRVQELEERQCTAPCPFSMIYPETFLDSGRYLLDLPSYGHNQLHPHFIQLLSSTLSFNHSFSVIISRCISLV